METQAIEGVAEYESFAGLREIERLHPEMVARAEKRLPSRVPDGKSEIPTKALDALFIPGGIGMNDQFRIGRRRPHLAPGLGEGRNQVHAAIHTGIGNDSVA